MMMIWNSDNARAYRIGEAIANLCVAFDGWIDWGADGKVRFLSKKNGRVGMFFPKWIIDGMKENKEFIKKYIEFLRSDRKVEPTTLRVGGNSIPNPPCVGSVRTITPNAKTAAPNETN